MANPGCSGQRLRRLGKRARLRKLGSGLAVVVSQSPPLPLSPTLGQGSRTQRRRGGFEGSGKGWQEKARARRQKPVLAVHSMAGAGAGRTARQKQARGKNGTLPRGKASAKRQAKYRDVAEALAATVGRRLRAEGVMRWCQAGLRWAGDAHITPLLECP